MKYFWDIVSNLNAVVRLGGFVSFVPPMRWEHRNDCFEQNKFYYITKGRCNITIEGKSYTAKAGDWFFIPAGANHSYHNFSDEILEKHWMHFDLYPNARIFETLGLEHFVRVSAEDKIDQLFLECSEKFRSDKLADKLEVKAALLRLLAEYIRLSKKEQTVEVDSGIDELAPVFLYISKNLNGLIENSLLAELCHMHPRYFIRFFKEKTGETPQGYVMRLRMEAAKTLLEQTKLTISEIAETLGLCDTAHLCKSFRRFYAMSPSQYRKLLEKEQQVLLDIEKNMKSR